MDGLITFATSFYASAPKPLLAFIVFIVGWCAALLMRFGVSRLLKLVRFDALSDRTGFAEFLRKGNVHYAPSMLLGRLGFWVVLLIALFQISRLLDISVVNAVFEQVISGIPSVLAAVFVFTMGAVLVSFFANFAMTLASNAGLPHSRFLARVIKYCGNTFVAVAALDQIGFGRSIINSMFLLLFAAVVFGVALAFGLGCKDIARETMQKFLRNLRERNDRGTDLEG